MPAPIITIAQMREWESATWSAGIEEANVIKQAGQATAHMAQKMTQNDDVILVLAGKGHNGDDADEAVAFIKNRRVKCHRILDPDEAVKNLPSWLNPFPQLIIDGLFGIGLSRNLSSSWIELIEAINETHIDILAVDVPSGLNADTGSPMGTAIQATLTLCMGSVKRGLLLPKAMPYIGRLEVASKIGLIDCPCQSEFSWILPEDFRGFPPSRKALSHKGTYGHLLIVAGSMGYHGAAVLAAKAAQRACPGLITLWTSEPVYYPIASQLQAVMVDIWKPGRSIPPSTTAIVAGPGLASPEIPQILKKQIADWWVSSPLPMVVDASALDWLPQISCASPAIRIITPHPGEAARLLSISTEELQNKRLEYSRELSCRYGSAYVVLKGYLTLIGNSSGRHLVNSTGNPMLAQGGSGDILAGFLGGLIAQPRLSYDPEKTVSYAVWQHGAAADFLNQQSGGMAWPIENLLNLIGNVAPILLPSVQTVV